jgi:hypothetical protein
LEFPFPTKIHFAGLDGEDVAAVFADRIVHHKGGFSFYLGELSVAVLAKEYLMIGPRQIECSALDSESPFWHDLAEK